MKRTADVLLLVVQWALVLLGVYGLAANIYLYVTVPDWVYPMPSPSAAEHILKIDVRSTFLVQGLTFSLIAVGLGGVLFYLRRLYFSRHQ